MKMTTNFLPPPEVVITPEAIATLASAIFNVQVGILKGWRQFPPAIQALMEEITIEPDLRETEPDRIRITTKLYTEAFGAGKPRISVAETLVVIQIKCLDPEIETHIENVFKDIILKLMEQLSINLQEFLHTILIPIKE